MFCVSIPRICEERDSSLLDKLQEQKKKNQIWCHIHKRNAIKIFLNFHISKKNR